MVAMAAGTPPGSPTSCADGRGWRRPGWNSTPPPPCMAAIRWPGWSCATIAGWDRTGTCARGSMDSAPTATSTPRCNSSWAVRPGCAATRSTRRPATAAPCCSWSCTACWGPGAMANWMPTCSPTTASSASARIRGATCPTTTTGCLQPASACAGTGAGSPRTWPWAFPWATTPAAWTVTTRMAPAEDPNYGSTCASASSPDRPATMRSSMRSHPAMPAPVRRAMALAAALAMSTGAVAAPPRDALPEDGRAVAGRAGMARGERTLTVTQHSQRAIIEWRSFDIGADARVDFVQPSASSVVLNRVVGGTASQLAGQLHGNGHVYLVNPAGVLFAPGARVDAGNLVTSTLDIGNEDFMAGHDRMGSLVEQTGLAPAAPDAGPAPPPLVVADPRSDDEDEAAPGGTSAPPGRLLTLDAGAAGHLRVGLDPEQVQALIDGGDLREDGDYLVLSDEAGNALAANAVAEGGAPRAGGATLRDGRLLLVAPRPGNGDATDARPALPRTGQDD